MDLLVEGIILKQTPLKETSVIATAYTKELGLLSFVTPTRGRHTRSLITPLSHLELVLTPPRSGELFRLHDVSALTTFLTLRNNLERIRSAGSCMSAILKSQLPNKPSPALFTTLRLHLEQLENSQMDPKIISAQFIIKLLKHEGLLEVPKNCSECGQDLVDAYIERNGVHCTRHKHEGSLVFNPEEYATLSKLFATRTWLHIPFSQHFSSKIEEIFTQKLDR